jgi:hypothetical protein
MACICMACICTGICCAMFICACATGFGGSEFADFDTVSAWPPNTCPSNARAASADAGPEKETSYDCERNSGEYKIM